jgi:type II secretory pathway pseudopilin PulG
MKKTKTSRKKAAFTLAETLIAIGIIGVVAALTIPTLVKNYQQRQTCMQLKKVYSLLQQATRAAQNDYGDMSAWDLQTSSTFIANYVAPYMKLSLDNSSYCNTNLRDEKSCPSPKYSSLDGTLYWYGKGIQSLGHIFVDLNGLSGPNRFGRDIFVFTYRYDLNELWTYSHYKHASKSELKLWANMDSAGESRQCFVGALGYYCSSRIYLNDWKIPKSYPW